MGRAHSRSVFPLCGDNPELRLELTAQKEIIVVIDGWSPSDILNEVQFSWTNIAKLGCLIYPPRQRNVYVYRPGHAPQRLYNPQSVPGDPELLGFTLDLRKSGNNAT